MYWDSVWLIEHRSLVSKHCDAMVSPLPSFHGWCLLDSPARSKWDWERGNLARACSFASLQAAVSKTFLFPICW